MIRWARLFVVLASIIAFPALTFAKTPDCTNPDAWPSGITFTYLKNAGVVDNESLDFKKTKVIRLASEQRAKGLYRQVHLIQFFKKSGEEIDVIAVNETSNQECSMSEVDVYLVSKKLGISSLKH